MTTEEKLQLIDHLRSGFAKSIQQIVKDEPGIVGNIRCNVTFYGIEEATPLWNAALNLGWKYAEYGRTMWIVSENNQGDTTLFL